MGTGMPHLMMAAETQGERMKTERVHLHAFGGHFAVAIIERRCANWIDPISHDLCLAPLESDVAVYCTACEAKVSGQYPGYLIPRLPEGPSKCRKCAKTREWYESRFRVDERI